MRLADVLQARASRTDPSQRSQRLAHLPIRNDIAGNFRWQELEGDGAMQPRVLGLVDNAHAAAAKPTAKHIPQHRTDTGCAPDKASTLTGRHVLSGCARALRRRRKGWCLALDYFLGPSFVSHIFSMAGSNTGAEREVSQGRILCAS